MINIVSIDTSNIKAHQRQPESSISQSIGIGYIQTIRYVRSAGDWVIYSPLLIEDAAGQVERFSSRSDALSYLDSMQVETCVVDGR